MIGSQQYEHHVRALRPQVQREYDEAQGQPIWIQTLPRRYAGFVIGQQTRRLEATRRLLSGGVPIDVVTRAMQGILHEIVAATALLDNLNGPYILREPVQAETTLRVLDVMAHPNTKPEERGRPEPPFVDGPEA